MLNNIQVLRAVAACFVVFMHMTMLNDRLLGSTFSFGMYGVDLFFVISGFVMVYTTSARPVTPLQFMTNRIVRIVPLYWALTAIVFALALLAPALLKATTDDPMELVKSLLFIPFAKSNGLVQPVLFPGWTLNYEMFFYAIFASTLLIPSIRVRVATATLLLVGLVGAGWMLAPTSTVMAFYTSPLILEFAYGMIIGLFQQRLRNRPPPIAASIALAAGGLALIVLLPSLIVPLPARAFTIGLPAALVVAATIALDARRVSIRSSFLLLIGAASYSLYLVHPFVLGILAKIVARLGLDHGTILLPVIVAALAFAVAAGVAVHLLFERPIDRALRRRLRGPGPAAQDADSALWPWRRAGIRSKG